MINSIAGIDPGFSGAIAIYDSMNLTYELYDMPIIQTAKKEIDEIEVKNIFILHNVKHIFIEKAHSMPQQNSSAEFRYATGYGLIRGICVGLGIPYTLITPQRWKKVMMDGMGKEKGQSIIRAKQLFPNIELNRKKDHGKADALLLTEYGRRTFELFR